MPRYVSKAAQDRDRFLDVREARDEICAEDGCLPEEADWQIRDMLADEVIQEPRWLDTGELAPGEDRHWLEVDIDAITGLVLDDFAWARWNAIWGPGGPRHGDAWLHADDEPVAKWRPLGLDKVSFRATRGTLQPSAENVAPEEAAPPPAPPEAKPGDEVPLGSPDKQQADAGGGAGARKPRPAPAAATLVAWFDALPPNRQKKTPNALIDQYFNEDPNRKGSISKRHAAKVLANPAYYRGRV